MRNEEEMVVAEQKIDVSQTRPLSRKPYRQMADEDTLYYRYGTASMMPFSVCSSCNRHQPMFICWVAGRLSSGILSKPTMVQHRSGFVLLPALCLTLLVRSRPGALGSTGTSALCDKTQPMVPNLYNVGCDGNCGRL